jgi:hypothetical protein
VHDPQNWAPHYRKRAAECIELADSSFDEDTEAHYRSPAGRYIKLAEAEDFAVKYGGHDPPSAPLDAAG